MQKIFAVFACVFANFAFYFKAYAYTLLQPLPGLNVTTAGPNLTDYLGWLFRFMLVAAAFAALVQIIIGGIQTVIGGASETARSDAKKRIQDAIYGLLLALASWLILWTINPDLATMKLTIPEIKITMPVVTPPPPPGQCQNCVSLAGELGAPYVKSSACTGGASNCKVNQAVATKLKTLITKAGELGLANKWFVTEAHPPTVAHLSSCHNNGTCVDISFRTSSFTCTDVDKLKQAATASGFGVINEFVTCGGNPYQTTTGPNLHLNL